MTDAYIQRSVSPQTKLAIIYIFNDIVQVGRLSILFHIIIHFERQRDPLTFASPGYRCLMQVIAPLVGSLPPDIKNAHDRTLDILKDRQIYTKEQIAPIRRAFGISRVQQKAVLANSLARIDEARKEDLIFEVCKPAFKGKVRERYAQI